MTKHPAHREPEPASAPSNRLGRILFRLRAIWVICLAPFIFALAAAVMMIDREITAPTWIKERVEARAQDLLAGSSLEFGAITVRLARDLHPTVRLVDTRLLDADGALVARVPLIEGLMSPRGLVLQQEVLMQEVRMRGAQINLRRAASGEVSFALAAEGTDVQQAQSLTALLDQMDAVFERPALEALAYVQADGLIVNFDDARAGRSWLVDGGTATLDLRGGQTALRGDFVLLSGRAEVTSLNLSYVSPRGSRAAQLAVNLTDVVASDIAAQSPAMGWLRGFDAPMTAALRTELDADGALGPLNAALEIGQGVFQPNAAADPVGFESAKAYFTYDPMRDLITFTEASVASSWGQLSGSGEAYLRDFDDGLPQALLAQFRLNDVAVNPPGFFETPPELEGVTVDLRARFDPFRVEIGQLVAVDGATRVMAQGAVAATNAGWDIALDAQINEITPDRLVSFWPQTIKRGSRQWFSSNLRGGRLFNMSTGFRAAPDTTPQLAMGFEFAGNEIQMLRSLPPVQGAKGVARIENNSFYVTLDEGVVQAPQGGPMQLAGSDFQMVDMRLNPSPAILDLAIDSSLTAALSILNQPPFQYMDKAGLPVTIADGRAVTTGQITWPLEPSPPPDSIQMEMTATLRNVRSETLVRNKLFVAPRLDVVASRRGVNIAGTARVGDVPAIGAWDQRFGDPEQPGSRLLAQVDLSQSFLDEFGIALPRGAVSGSGKGEIGISFQDDTPPAFTLASDLLGIRVAIPAIGWAKSPNTTGTLQVTGILGDVPRVDRLAISGGGLRAVGRINATAAGTLETARFSTVQVGNWLNAPITLRGRGRGVPVGVEINGGTLDLRGARFGDSQEESGPLSLALDRLQVSEGIALTEFRGDFRGAGGFRGEFTGRLNGDAPVQGTVAPRNGRSAMRLRSNDAGAVLRAAGLTPNARGGVFDLTLLPARGGGTFNGALDIRDIRIQDAPAMAAVLDAISVVGLLQQLDGQGLAFEEVAAQFQLTPSQVLISEASAVGPGLGISIDGIYMLASKELNLQGVVSPFFFVNNIGSFLTRRGEGLIGFNYTIGGTTAAPDVSVNPLSVFTPGMFREIFRRPAPDVSQ